MEQIINDFINSIDTKLYNRIRASKGDAECRRYLKEHLQKQLSIHGVSSSFKLGQTINIKQADGDFIIDAIGKDGCYAHNWETGETEWVEENDLLPI